MRIPKRFKLMGQTIEVIETNEPFVEHTDACAFASYRLNQIQMRPKTNGYEKTEEQRQASFCHELMHFITYHAGPSYNPKKYEYMHKDENFIDMAGNLLHQALTTMEYN